MDGEGGHQERLSDSTSAPPGLVAVGHAMGRSIVRGYNIAVQAKISTKDLYGFGRCSGMDH